VVRLGPMLVALPESANEVSVMRCLLPCLTSALFLVVGCGGADENPLGGPYGGSASVPGPTSGSVATGGDDSGSTQPATSNTGGSTDGGNSSAPDSGHSQGGSKDAAAPPPPQDSGSQSQDTGQQASAPTWTQLFTLYLAGGTVGNCGTCHSEMGSATKAYSWLEGKHQLPGPNPGLVDPNSSYLTWYGGDMPPGGPSSEPTAVMQMNAWAAAGAPNN
jgi:hypothetical protein